MDISDREQQVQRWESTWFIQGYNKQTSATGTDRRKKRLERDGSHRGNSGPHYIRPHGPLKGLWLLISVK